jgi:tetrahydromethanopterin S-methyltransferase subunit B
MADVEMKELASTADDVVSSMQPTEEFFDAEANDDNDDGKQ